MNRKHAIFFLAIVHIGFLLLQGAEIRGVVKDIYNEPLSVVSIQLLPDGAVTLTDPAGEFKLAIPDELKGRDISIVAKHRRYHPQQVRISPGKEVVNILLIPKELIQEEVSVTALNKQERIIEVPMAESSLSELDIQEQMPESVAATLTAIPGIHFIGKGGFSITPSIRGLARRRVLILVDGARLTSDRRVGVSASFIPPDLVRRIEVVRSSSSVLYGSDAIGGVVQIFTAPRKLPTAERNGFHLSANSGNQRLATGLTLEKKSNNHFVSAGFNYLQAENYSSSAQEILHSGFTYYAGTLSIGYYNDERDVSIGYLGGFGKDVGKPERTNSHLDYSMVPDESEQILRLDWMEKNLLNNGTLQLSVYVNPSHYDLEKISESEQSLQKAVTDVTNMGVRMMVQKSLNPNLSYRAGIEWFSRQNLRIENINSVDGRIDKAFPLTGGARSDVGVFATMDYRGLQGFDIIGGVRFSHFSLEAVVQEENKSKSSSAPSAFLGITRKLGQSLSVFVDVGKAFRLPSLSEAFYTGISGRRYVVGNPDLQPESSLNIDAGFKFFSRSLFLGLYGFSYTIDHMIERFRDGAGVYTYDNVSTGRIQGVEGEFQLLPVRGLELFGHLSLYKGRIAGTATPLNDVPAARVFVGAKALTGKFYGEINYLHAFAKKDPGPAEVFNRDYDVVNLKGGYYFSANFFFFARISNLFDTLYFANPDPDIPEAAGVEIAAGLKFYF